MWKLLISDSNKVDSDALRDCIDWGEFDIRIVDMVQSSADALNYIKNNPVEILLTDVSMPHMSGIELVEEIRRLGFDTRVIFLSSSLDLEHLRRALHLDVADYIRKPVVLRELTEALQKAGVACHAEVQKKWEESKLKGELDKAKPMIRERFVMDLLSGRVNNREYISARMPLLFPEAATDDCFTVMSVSLTSPDQNFESNETFFGFLKNQLENDRPEFFYACAAGSPSLLNIIMRHTYEPDSDELIECGEKICTLASEGSRITVGIGHTEKGIYLLSKSYEDSVIALEEKAFFGEGGVIHINDIHVSAQGNFSQYLAECDKAIAFINTKGMGAASAAISELFLRMEADKKLTLAQVRQISLKIALELSNQTIKHKSGSSEQDAPDVQYIFKLNTFDEMKDWISDSLLSTAERIGEEKRLRADSTVSLIRQYVFDHYNQDLSLKAIAGNFYITPNYICLLFKREFNMTLNEYIATVRISKAKEILSDPKVKVTDVSELVGYKDPDYFTRIFRKYEGVTPSEYKSRMKRSAT